MNFKYFIFLFILLTFQLVGCGVKSKPLSPPEQAIPSYVNSYTGEESIPVPTTPTSSSDKKKKN